MTSPAAGTDGDRPRLSSALIVEVALEQMRKTSYDQVTMRSIAQVLGTGPASLYVHVRDRAELDQMMVERIMGGLDLPVLDSRRWDEQVRRVLTDLLTAYRAHPGVARAALGAIPSVAGSLQLAEWLLSALLSAGVRGRDAAWAVDMLLLYVAAAAFDESVWVERGTWDDEGATTSNPEFAAFFRTLPPRFPTLRRYAREASEGTPGERFQFGIGVILGGLTSRSVAGRGDETAEPTRAGR
ncbi:MAG: TetR/AcrR family transcriptional regulator [Dermatophilaceae bacterium]